MQTNYFQRNAWRSHSICGQTISIYFQCDISKQNFGGNQGGGIGFSITIIIILLEKSIEIRRNLGFQAVNIGLFFWL